VRAARETKRMRRARERRPAALDQAPPDQPVEATTPHNVDFTAITPFEIEETE
jgi:hypothetical protein